MVCERMNLLDASNPQLHHYLAARLRRRRSPISGADVIAVEPIEGAFQRNWAVANHFVAATASIIWRPGATSAASPSTSSIPMASPR